MDLGPDPIRKLLTAGIPFDSLLAKAGSAIPIHGDRIAFDPPIIQPSKILCIGLNYRDQCRVAGVEAPQTPMLFTKHSSSLTGSGSPIVIDPAVSTEVDYEIELAVVIGRRCKDVSREDALSAVAGYTIANDVSARDIQMEEGQWVRAKSFDSFCPLGPYLVTSDEIPDPQQLGLRTVVSGDTLQDSSTNEMIFSVAELIAHVSTRTTLEPGDVILTGTPWGTGAFRDPPVYLTHGDDVRCSITGLGELRNSVVAIDNARVLATEVTR